MRFMRDLLQMQAKQKMEKVKANLSALEIFCIQIYEAANETKGSILG